MRLGFLLLASGCAIGSAPDSGTDPTSTACAGFTNAVTTTSVTCPSAGATAADLRVTGVVQDDDGFACAVCPANTPLAVEVSVENPCGEEVTFTPSPAYVVVEQSSIGGDTFVSSGFTLTPGTAEPVPVPAGATVQVATVGIGAQASGSELTIRMNVGGGVPAGETTVCVP